jgi:hypothetical protein
MSLAMSRAFMDGAQELAGRCDWTAARLERARIAVALAGAIAHEAVLVGALPGRRESAMIFLELLATWTGVEVSPMVIGEVGPLEGAVLAPGFVEDRNVRVGPALMHEPAEHLGRAVGTVNSLSG